MKILVTGSYGQLGRSLFNNLKPNIEIFWTGRNIPLNENGFYLDICDRINLRYLISLHNPDILINLAALTNVDFCEKNSDLAKEINTNGVRNICDTFQGKIVQLSTDYVFDGKNGPYTPPSFSHIYKLSSVLNTGKGNQWYGFNIEKVGMLEDATMYERAKKFYNSFANRG